ncbi:NUP85 [Candida oxycetoniae]|uniref:Nuclear pore complex protein Nup85 n=1 Tax=Candida oxycetoniae TaxID=497107 RepID=A0AAI9SZQ2_9ASCO|nr:NUP85 [Candida oxycetoniae]KAI3406171.2 NUP85 [Candida oxycetoniae]
MLVLTELSQSQAITNSAEVQLNGEEVLVLSQGNEVRIYTLEVNTFKLRGVKSLPYRVLSWAKIIFQHECYILFIDAAHKLYIFNISQGMLLHKMSEMKVVLLCTLSSKGQQLSANLEKPIFVPQRLVDPEYVLLHLFYSNIQVISITAVIEEMQKGTAVLSSAVEVISAPIGSVDIVQIVSLDDASKGTEKDTAIRTEEHTSTRTEEHTSTRTEEHASTRKRRYRHRHYDDDTTNTEFAILYKDFLSNFSIRFVSFDFYTGQFSITRQFAQFDEEPSLIVPWSFKAGGGFLAFTSSSLFYFPSTAIKHMSLARNLKDVCIISNKSKDLRLIMTLNKPGRGKSRAVYKSFEVIDNSRILLVTEMGKCYMFYADIEKSTSNALVVNQLNLIDIGDLTVPMAGSLHHVKNNLFFQASRVSKSVLFEIFPTRPNINILGVINSSPPVIDISRRSTRRNFYTCQGGWDGSELRRYSDDSRGGGEYNIVNSATQDTNFFLISAGFDNGKYLYENLDIAGSSKFLAIDKDSLQVELLPDEADNLLEKVVDNGREILITKQNFQIDKQVLLEKAILFGHIIRESELAIMVTDDGRIYFCEYSIDGRFEYTIEANKEGLEEKEEKEEVTCVDICKVGHRKYWIIAGFLSGKSNVWLFSNEAMKMVHNEGLEAGSRSVFAAAIFTNLDNQSARIYAFLSYTNKEVQQLTIERQGEKCPKLFSMGSTVLHSMEPYHIKRRGSEVVMFNSHDIIVPRMIENLNIYGFTRVPKSNVTEIVFTGANTGKSKVEEVLVTFSYGLAERAQLEFGTRTHFRELNVLYSNKLFTKCIVLPQGQYLVAVVYDRSQVNMDIRTELVLVRLRDFKVTDTFKFNDDSEVVDLCEISECAFSGIAPVSDRIDFITLSSSDQYPLGLFRIQDSKIKLREKCVITGLRITKDVKLQNMTQIHPDDSSDNDNDNHLVLMISGTVLVAVDLIYDGQYKCKTRPKHYTTVPSFAVSQSFAQHEVFIADAIEGICCFDMVTFARHQWQFHLEKDRALLTCMTLTGTNDLYLVTGDTSGKIYIDIHGKLFKKVGVDIDWGQINTIVKASGGNDIVKDLAFIGTSSGGLYLLGEVTNRDFIEKLKDIQPWLVHFASNECIHSVSQKDMEVDNDNDTDETLMMKVIDTKIAKKFLEIRKFEDIEMLELPQDAEKVEDDGDDVSVTSETESLSESPELSEGQIQEQEREKGQGRTFESSTNSPCHSPHLSPLSTAQILCPDNEYPDLMDWINSDKELEFHADGKLHKLSSGDGGRSSSRIQRAYIEYVNSNYKTVENLLSSLNDTENDYLRSPSIGVISKSVSNSNNNNNNNNESVMIDEAFQDIVDHLTIFAEQPVDNIEDMTEKEKLRDVLSILKCIASTYFYGYVRRKPEMVIDWVNNFDPEPSSELINEIMVDHENSYMHPLFWNSLVCKMVSRGLFQQADEVIQHSNYEELEELNPFLFCAIKDIKNLLTTYTSYALKGQFPQWKLLACEFRDSLSSSKNDTSQVVENAHHRIMLTQIYDIACVMTGLPRTIAIYSNTWYDVYLALCLYQIRDNDQVYENFFRTAVTEKPPPPPPQSLSLSLSSPDTDGNLEDRTELTFINILEENLMKVMETIFSLSPATASYVAILMELKGLFKNYYFGNKEDIAGNILNKKLISEYFLLCHAYNCLNVYELVPVGVGILSNEWVNSRPESREHNCNTIANFLPNYNVGSNNDLEWALAICADLNLTSTARDLYFQAGVQAFDDGYLYEALNHFVNCYDPLKVSGKSHQEGLQKIHYIVWEVLFTDCIVNNSPVRDELINSIIDQKVDLELHPIIQQCISPYAVLKEFYDSLSDSSIKVAAKLSKIIHLLKFQFLPKKFCPLLLSQFLPFLSPDSKLRLPDLLIMVELIDNFETEASDEEKREGEQLYTYSIMEQDQDLLNEHDWRKIVEPIPPNVESLVLALRCKTITKIGQIFIE